MIKHLYEGFECYVFHEGKLTYFFEVTTGVRQACVLSLILFHLVLDSVMNSHKRQKERKQ